ncbi:MAG: tol-pal system protein YbgF [Candidatus Berkiella sp.]
MKTKMSRFFNRTCLVIAMFSLLNIGTAWSMALVESRSPAHWDEEEGQQVDRAAERSALDMLKKMEFLQQEVQELRGKVEEQNYQLQQVQEHQKKLYLDLDRRLREGGPAKMSGVSSLSLAENGNSNKTELQGAVDARVSSQLAVAETQVQPAALTGLPAVEDSQAEEKAYQNAYRLIQNKDYEGALNGFKTLITNFPKGKYVPNASYWLGEIYLVKGNLDLAYESFDRVYRDHPGHPKAADSLLKLGYVEYSKGQWKQSNDLLMQVKNQYPGTTSAQLADSKLDKMRQEGHL